MKGLKFNKKSTIIVAIVIVVFLILTIGHSKLTKSSFAFDTYISISIYDKTISTRRKGELIDEAFNLCRQLDEKFSKTNPQSEIYKANNSRVVLSDETKNLLEYAAYFHLLSNEKFDVTIESLTTLWDVKNRSSLPTKEEIDEALDSIGARYDFGAIVKGYACDRIKEYFKSNSVRSAVINLGGNITCIGSKSLFEDFNIGIERPFSESSNDVIKVLHINDKSVVTSGIYQRYFKVNGDDKIYSHIIDPKTGYPVDNNLYSVTVISNSSLIGDMLSTTLLLVNPDNEEMAEIIKKVNKDFSESISVIVVDDKFSIHEFNTKSSL